MQDTSATLLRASKFIRAFIISALIVNANAHNENLACTFDLGMCNFTTSVDYSWTRRSGPTPSGTTGPSSDHTTGDGYYMYVEASSPNGIFGPSDVLDQLRLGRALEQIW